MKASEILRKLADIIDSKESDEQSTEIVNRPEQIEIDVEQPTDTQDIESNAQVNTRSMVAPLQQKLELMKKMAGEDGSDEEMEIMKRNAGIAPIVVSLADEDEPFEG